MSDKAHCQIGKSRFIIDLDLKSYRKHVNRTHDFEEIWGKPGDRAVSSIGGGVRS